MRKEFGKTIIELAEKDNEIYLIIGDIGYGVFDEFRQKFSNRFINLGIREQSMVSFASGMALEGLKPYVYTITPFLIERAFEQIKLNVNQQNVNVKLIGYADYPKQGLTHSELDAEILMGLVGKSVYSDSLKNNLDLEKEFLKRITYERNIVNYFPKNSIETRTALIESYQHKKPTFISLKKDKL
ncbi:MAG: hypothetical protein AABW67_02800 [Nanoarchaeota archaeon]|mgnify:CR=1 FL=1